MAKKWTDESAARALELYLAKVESDGKEAAAVEDFLNSIAADEKVQAVSGKAVRSKLTVMGEYQKPDAVASVAKTNTIRKEHYVRALANVLSLDVDDLDSLKNAKMDALKAIAVGVGVSDVVAASAKGYELTRAEMLRNIVISNGLDVEDTANEMLALEIEASE